MSFPKQDNVRYALLGNNSENGAEPDGTLAVPTNVTAGDVLLLDGDNNIVSAGGGTTFANVADDAPLRICRYAGAGNKHNFSPAFTKATTVIPAADTDAVAAVQQVSTIGFNGTSGALPVADDTNFFIKIRKNDNDAANRSQPTALWGQFKTPLAAATQFDLGVGLVDNLTKNLSIQPGNGYAYADLMADDAGQANGGAGTVTVATGETVVTFGTNVDANAVVGDYLHLDESVGGSPDDTDPWYRIIAFDLTTESATIDRPYSGTSMSGAAEANCDYQTAANLAGDDTGVRIKGKENK